MFDDPFDWSPIYQPPRHRPPWWKRGLAAVFAFVSAWPRWLTAVPRALGSALVAAAAYARLVVTTLGPPLALPLAGVLALYTYWKLPRGLWSAWPIFALMAAPVVAVALAQLLGRCYQRPSIASFPRSAADWLIDRVRLSPALGLSVAELVRDNRRSFYHPATRTIVLATTVRDEHTARAYAIAAHELGHALAHARAPRLAAFSLWSRSHAQLCFQTGLLLLLGIALTGSAMWLPFVLVVLLAAAVMQASVALDELAASWIAMRELRQLATDGEQPRAARRYLLAAFSTYASHALALLLPLLLWPRLTTFFGDGFLRPGQTLTAAASLLATLAAVTTLAGLVATILLFILPERSGALRSPLRNLLLIAIAPCLLSIPLLTVLTSVHPASLAMSWALMLAILPAHTLLSIPVNIAASFLVARLPDLSLPDSPLLPRSGLGLRQISLASLREPRSNNFLPLLLLWLALVLPTPLALITLFS